jgi:tRNA pseudouridine38/39 synthase
MVAVLFLIGSGREQPSLIDALLDIRSHPARPTYEMAPDAPLLLYSIQYPGLQWTPHAPNTLAGLAVAWAREAEASALRSAMLHTMRLSLLNATVPPPDTGSGGGESAGVSPRPWRELLQQTGEGLPTGGWGGRGGKYIPVLERPTADSLEERTATHEAKKARKEARDTGLVALAPA